MKKVFITAVLASMIFATAAAMPPHPGTAGEYGGITLQQPVPRLLSNSSTTGKEQGSASFPLEGTENVLVLVAGFSDEDIDSVSTDEFYDSLFEEGPDTDGDGTGDGFGWKQYYQDMSNGKLILNFDVYYVGKVSKEHDYYGSNTSTSGSDAYPGQFVAEAVSLGDSSTGPDIDYSKYDNDNDGYVDAVIVIHQGQGEEYTGLSGGTDMWSHRWDLYSANISENGGAGYSSYANDSNNDGVLEYDGVLINSYAIQPEYLAAAGDTTIGIFVHEFGHILGLVDLYDTSYTTDGIGDWGLMSSGAWLGPNGNGARPAPLSAWSRMHLGWLTVETAASFPPAGIKSTGRPLKPPVIMLFIFSLFLILTAMAAGRNKRLKIPALLVSVSLIAASSCSSGSRTTVKDVALADIEVSYKAERVDINETEYLLAENKVKKDGTWTEYLPGKGLLIYHIDNSIITERYQYNTVNDYSITNTFGIGIIEADRNGNLLDPDDKDSGSATDPFYYGNSDYLTDIKANSGETASIAINSIGSAGDVITFRVLKTTSD